jgi:HEAT repeat protein
VPHVIALLGSTGLADYAVFALRKVAEEHVGQLTDAMLSPEQPVEVRRRLARVFSICVSQRAADALMQALEDSRFDVRVQAARSLTAIVDRNPRVQFDQGQVFSAVLKEVEVSRPVWQSHRLLEGTAADSTVDAVVRERAGQSLSHVFALLSLVLPREPLQVAFRSLRSGDANLRGTALEYLEGVLPPAIRQPLWPFLVSPRVRRHERPSLAAISELLHSSPSITVKGMAEA